MHALQASWSEAMNESLHTGDVGLESRPYRAFFFLMRVECCKPPDHRSWLKMEERTILLDKSIAEAAGLRRK